MNHYSRIVSIIESDQTRMAALHAVKDLSLPDWLIGAGFVRNAIWDDLYNRRTEINDIDVIYFSKHDISDSADLLIEETLRKVEPALPWSVKNQARMHLKNGDRPYKNTLDAMSYWPERQTSIGVKLEGENIVLEHCFDLSFQFNEQINRNPNRSVKIFKNRIHDKQWQQLWPSLQIKP